MEPWVCGDGSRIWLGGRVDGDGPVAVVARQVFVLVRSGDLIGSGYGAEPETEPLDLDVPHLLDAWVRMQADEVVSAPVVEYPTLDPDESRGGDLL